MKSKIFVFDTNAFISAALLAGSVSSRALDKAFQTGSVAISAATFSELTEVLFRSKFDKYFSDERRLQVIQKLERDTLKFEVDIVVNACRDPKDNKFLELAIAASACCIITGDQDLLVMHPFNDIQIISAADFLNVDV